MALRLSEDTLWAISAAYLLHGKLYQTTNIISEPEVMQQEYKATLLSQIYTSMTGSKLSEPFAGTRVQSCAHPSDLVRMRTGRSQKCCSSFSDICSNRRIGTSWEQDEEGMQFQNRSKSLHDYLLCIRRSSRSFTLCTTNFWKPGATRQCQPEKERMIVCHGRWQKMLRASTSSRLLHKIRAKKSNGRISLVGASSVMRSG